MAETSIPTDIYDECYSEETMLNFSSMGLISVPNINNKYLYVLYLRNNKIGSLPDNFFTSLPNLTWLDLRDNELFDIPKSVKNHKSLTHLLLQNNKVTSLPNELGTVKSLKGLQLSGNPIMYPPRNVLESGTYNIIKFLKEKYIEDLEESRSVVSDKINFSEDLTKFLQGGRSYNSVIEGAELNHKTLSVQLNEKDISEDDEYEPYSKTKGKCPKLQKSRAKTLPCYRQSEKYLKPLRSRPQKEHENIMKRVFLKDMALKKQKDLIEKRDKILQGRRNIEFLRNWQKEYKNKQLMLTFDNDTYKLSPKSFPYDTSPEYMTLLSRDDIEKDLPDKYKRKLYRKSKPTVPRKNNTDARLAMKIKQLFENLEQIDLNCDTMTPRTEQKVLLGEIQKISEIKQKLMELSTTNSRSVTDV